VRERLASGDSDEVVKQFLVARYGDYVLLNPPVKPATYVLWFGPAALLLAGGLGVALYFHRRRHATGVAPLSLEERQRLDRLLPDGEAGG
jgi:cytochrome c-type biogenesis protein CcmH